MRSCQSWVRISSGFMLITKPKSTSKEGATPSVQLRTLLVLASLQILPCNRSATLRHTRSQWSAATRYSPNKTDYVHPKKLNNCVVKVRAIVAQCRQIVRA
eukprot:4890602-Amphidinium_carterae.2